MRIKKVHVENFRSIKRIDIDFENLMIFIGQNNHGKTNVLLTLNFFFDSASKLKDEDFFYYRKAGDNKLLVEITFDNLTDEEKTTFKKYLLTGDLLKVQKIAKLDGEEITQEYHGYFEIPDEPWLNPDNISDFLNREKLASIDSKYDIMSYFPSSGRITKAQVEEFQQSYKQEHKDTLSFKIELESGPFLGQKNVAAGILGNFYLIPAVKDISDETKIQATTNFGRLLNNVIKEMSEQNEEFQKIKEDLNKLMGSFNKDMEKGDEGRPSELVALEQGLANELKNWDISLDIQITPPEIEKLFQLGTDVYINDGVRTPVETKGHGLQRSLIFALVKVWSKTLNEMRLKDTAKKEEQRKKGRFPSESVFFAIEEPELFLHPQAQRQMLVSLTQLSEIPKHQILVCTHSSFFVDMNLYKSICIISKDSPQDGTKPFQYTQDLFEGPDKVEKKRKFNMAYWFNPDRSELFFSKKVALVEGPTEKTIFPLLATRLGIMNHEISIIDCGGKFNLKLYMEVLNAFKMHYILIHDIDPITVDSSDPKYEGQKNAHNENEKIKSALNTAYGKIETFDPNFEEIAGISRRATETKGKPVAALERFENDDTEIPSGIKEVVKLIFS